MLEKIRDNQGPAITCNNPQRQPEPNSADDMDASTRTFLITGGTGYIGTQLTERLLKQGHTVMILTRNPAKYEDRKSKNLQFLAWGDALADGMERVDVVIHLAGENLFGRRWNEEVKRSLRDSRVQTTRAIVDAIRQAENRPEWLISASAVGIYGDRGEERITEETGAGEDFLARLCVDWEAEALKAKELGVKVAIPRIGIVLGPESEVIKNMRLPFSLFVGGAIGSGKQYVPWIHEKDLVRALLFPLEGVMGGDSGDSGDGVNGVNGVNGVMGVEGYGSSEGIQGPYNACAPNPETMSELAAVMGRVMNRPSLFKVPGFALRIVLGEVASSILASLRVYPKRLTDAGFTFAFDDLEEALAEIL